MSVAELVIKVICILIGIMWGLIVITLGVGAIIVVIDSHKRRLEDKKAKEQDSGDSNSC